MKNKVIRFTPGDIKLIVKKLKLKKGSEALIEELENIINLNK